MNGSGTELYWIIGVLAVFIILLLLVGSASFFNDLYDAAIQTISH